MVRRMSSNATGRRLQGDGSKRNSPQVELTGLAYKAAISCPRKTRTGKVSVGSSFRGAVDQILNRGIVIDAWIPVSVAGLRVMDIEAEVILTSLETCLEYADGLGRTCLPVAIEPVEASSGS